MKYLALVPLLLLSMCSFVPAIEMVDNKIALTEEDQQTLKNCAAQGGCKVWTEEEIRYLLAVFRSRLIEAGGTCKRISI